MAGPIKCTPFCGAVHNKGDYKHHELLVTLLNIDTSTPLKQNEHRQLAKVIKKYEAVGWDKNSAIMDMSEEFRFPMLHWACVLGKPRTVRWLLENGFRATVQCEETCETAIHRSLLTLPDLSCLKSSRLTLFTALLSQLKACLKIGDHRQDTPLHIAAKCMARNKNFNLYESLFLQMVSDVQTMPEKDQQCCFNAFNSTGDTPLHILAASPKSFYVIQTLMNAGADPFTVNKLGTTPLDIAIQSASGRIVTLLKGALLQDCMKKTPNIAVNENGTDEEVRKRRSERSRTSTSQWYNMYYEEDADTDDTGSLEEQNDRNAIMPNNNKSTLPQNAEISVNSERVKGKETISPSKTNEVESPSKTNEVESPSQTNEVESPSKTNEVESPRQTNEVVTSSNLVDTVKEECRDVCQCHCEEDSDDILNVEDVEPEEATDNDIPILHVLKQAGVLPNLNNIIAKTKGEHLSRMKVLERSLGETKQELGKRDEKEKNIQQEMNQKRKELERLDTQLHKLKSEKETICKKRKLLENESGDLRKKLLCCEMLIKSVPHDSTGGSSLR